MSGPLRFRELRVRRMPGFEDGGFRLDDLAAGINLIHGPNASGKTTAARALQRLIWPASADDRASLEGRLTLDGRPWRVEVEGSRAVWERDGEAAQAPALPSVSARSRYMLSLTDLLESDDRDLADIIRVESAGGYDVAGAAKSLDFGAGGYPQSRMRALREAREKLKEANREAASLRDDRARFSELERRRAGLHRQASLVRALEDAIAVARARDAVGEAERAVASFPEGVALLRGNEIDQLDEWNVWEESLRNDRADAAGREKSAARALERAALGDEGLPSSELTTLDRTLAEIQAADSRIEADTRALEDARARRREVGRILGVDDDATPDFAAVDTSRIDTFLDRAHRVRSDREAVDARLRVLGDGPSAAEEAGAEEPRAEEPRADEPRARETGADATLSDGIRVLQSWLRTAPAGAAGGAWARLVTGSIVVFVVLAVLLVGAGIAWPPAVGIALVPAAAALVLLLRRPSRDTDPRAGLEAEARRLGHAPDAWTEDAVRTRLDALEKRAAAYELDAQRRAERDRVVRERSSLAEAEAALDAERTELASSLGMRLGTDDLTLALTAARLRQWDEARSAEVAAGARLAVTRSDRRAELDAAAAMVARFGHAPTDAASLAGVVDDLRDRRSEHDKAVASLETARRDRERAESEAASLAEKRAALLDHVGTADETAVRELAGHRDGYVAADRELDAARRELDRAESSLASAVDRATATTAATAADTTRAGGTDSTTALVAQLTAAPADELAHRLDEARAAAEQERGLEKEIAGIRANLERARTRHDVEDALAEVAAARAELEAQRDEDIDDAIGAALVEWLETSASEDNRPVVFRRARELLTQITRGHYRLDLARDGSAFRAYDTVAGRGRSLEELSAGTRIQLLLAVRVAFVETLEQGAAPPLLLDEVLANCDDIRATAIIDAAIALARAGRQVFYFTAQADELEKWRDALRQQYDVDWAERELADAAPRPAAFDWTGRPPSPPAVPAPEGRDHTTYGALLRVPAFDPWRDTAAALHVWYLVDDVDALHELLCLGIDRWGKLQEFVRHGGEDVPVIQAVLDDARRTADLCERFARLWRRGRGRPLDRTALEDSGAITETFLDRVSDLAQRLDGDADALLDALDRRQIPRFRESSVEELRTFCREHGHITDDRPMDDDRIHVALVAAATAHADATQEPTDPSVVAAYVSDLIGRLCHGPRDALAAAIAAGDPSGAVSGTAADPPAGDREP